MRTQAGQWDFLAILNTTNGGADWTEQASGIAGSLTSIYFTDANNGWTVGLQGKIYNTTDGGTNWTEQLGGAGTTTLSSVYFVDNNTGWACGWEGRIVKTSNGGEDWDFSYSGTPNGLTGLFAFDAENVWTVGGLGTILKLDADPSVGIKDLNSSAPSSFKLLQNYPNPFNPTTAIKYSIPTTSNVVIKIFDILGNEIETLANEENLMGTYEVTWSAENLPSGVYFYQLKLEVLLKLKK